MQGGLQQLEIIRRCLFRELDDHLTWRNAEILQQLQGAPRLMGCFEQGLRGHVKEQQARQLLLIEASASAFAAGNFQLAQASGLAGDGEQGDWGV